MTLTEWDKVGQASTIKCSGGGEKTDENTEHERCKKEVNKHFLQSDKHPNHFSLGEAKVQIKDTITNRPKKHPVRFSVKAFILHLLRCPKNSLLKQGTGNTFLPQVHCIISSTFRQRRAITSINRERQAKHERYIQNSHAHFSINFILFIQDYSPTLPVH